MFTALLAAYWWVPALVVLGIAWFVLRKFAKSHVKSFVESYLRTFDAAAFSAGELALPTVIADTYAAMPVFVKALLSKSVYGALVSIVFNEVKSVIESAAKSADAAPVAPTPVAPSETPAPVKPAVTSAPKSAAPTKSTK